MARNSDQLVRLLRMLRTASGGRLSWHWLLLVGAVLLAYVAVRPAIERQLGVALPHLVEWSADDSQQRAEPARPGPPVETKRHASSESVEGLHDFLVDAGDDEFRSPAGLRYTRGSAHGHRLQHILAHAVDQPRRPGSHGVFRDPQPRAVFELIDEAYDLARGGTNTRTKHEGVRTIHTVNLGRAIGYIGGESGGRRGHPQAKHLRLVLERDRVITAFPVRP